MKVPTKLSYSDVLLAYASLLDPTWTILQVPTKLSYSDVLLAWLAYWTSLQVPTVDSDVLQVPGLPTGAY